MNSIVFCNYSDEYFDEIVRPIFDKYGVKIVGVMRAFDDAIEIAAQDFDITIIFPDMALKSQMDVAKNLSNLYKKPHVIISKRSKDLSKELSDIFKKYSPIKLITPEPVKVTEQIPSETVETVETVETKTDVENLRKDLDDKIKEFEFLKLFTTEKNTTIHKLRCRIEELESQIQELNDMRILYEEENAQLVSGIEEAKSAIIVLQSDMSVLSEKRDKLVHKYNDLVNENSVLTARINELTHNKDDGDSLRQEIESIYILNKDDLMTDAEALERLYLIIGK